jgi:hypothetical protein
MNRLLLGNDAAFPAARRLHVPFNLQHDLVNCSIRMMARRALMTDHIASRNNYFILVAQYSGDLCLLALVVAGNNTDLLRICLVCASPRVR